MYTMTSLGNIVNLPLQTKVCVSGKIIKLRKLGNLIFVILFEQDGTCQIVFENESDFSYKKGDYISVEGFIRKWNDKIEVFAEKSVLLGSSNTRVTPSDISYSKMEKLILKSKVMQEINSYMKEREFLLVTSPTIVGNWVEGRTQSFEVDYFGTKKYLTLNSMLYHQIMLISGYSRIYEFSKIFRQDSSSPKDRLTEFISLDISISKSNKYEIMKFVEDMIFNLREKLAFSDLVHCDRMNSIGCISYLELMEKSGCQEISGAQLSKKARLYLDEHFDGFVWVYGFPEEKRRFFVKSNNGFCEDYQLWFRGKHQVASGGERETNLETMKMKIEREGKNILQYASILRGFESGVPPMCEIGFGLDRFLLDIIDGENISDLVAFPRNGNVNF